MNSADARFLAKIILWPVAIGALGVGAMFFAGLYVPPAARFEGQKEFSRGASPRRGESYNARGCVGSRAMWEYDSVSNALQYDAVGLAEMKREGRAGNLGLSEPVLVIDTHLKLARVRSYGDPTKTLWVSHDCLAIPAGGGD